MHTKTVAVISKPTYSFKLWIVRTESRLVIQKCKELSRFSPGLMYVSGLLTVNWTTNRNALYTHRLDFPCNRHSELSKRGLATVDFGPQMRSEDCRPTDCKSSDFPEIITLNIGRPVCRRNTRRKTTQRFNLWHAWVNKQAMFLILHIVHFPNLYFWETYTL